VICAVDFDEEEEGVIVAIADFGCETGMG